MNIFYFDSCPIKSAQAQPDKMLVKMPLETAQMLCTAHRELDGDEYADEVGLYKVAYKNHPCTIWARETHSNYRWLLKHFLALGSEYTFRYGKKHKSVEKLYRGLDQLPGNIPLNAMTPIAQAMPDQYKNKNAVKAYRDYYINEKSSFLTWTKRKTPMWMNND